MSTDPHATVSVPDFSGTPRYSIRRQLGVGATGVVYQGWDQVEHTEVAIKTLVRVSPRTLYRFKSEFRSLSGLHHPNLVALKELGVIDDTWFIVMELVRGVSFVEWVRGDDGTAELTTFFTDIEFSVVPDTIVLPDPSAPLEFDRVRNAIRQLLLGVATLHDASKLHRDIKPSNVVVTSEGRVVLLDFGLVHDADRDASQVSRIDRMVGTATFMAPEQALCEAPTPASDLYSVGVMLFQALTGRLPFEGTMVEMIAAKQVREAPEPVRFVDEIPADLNELCGLLLQIDPRLRPSARDALRRLGTEIPHVSRASSVVVGRDRERQRLEEAWSRVRQGRLMMVAVRGPAGIGKSTLVREFLAELKRFETPWLFRGRCVDGEDVPFKGVDALLDSVRRKVSRLSVEERRRLDPGELAPLISMFPVLADLFDDDAEIPTDAGSHRQAGLDAGVRLWRALAREQPIVLFLDDAQWGDVDSAQMLLDWGLALIRTRILVVVASRDEEGMLTAMLADPRWMRLTTSVIDVGPLSAEDIRKMAFSGLDDPQAVDWVVKEAAGHPLLAEELMRAAQSELIDLTSVRYSDILKRRLDRLDRSCQRFMLAVATADRPTPLRIIAAAAQVSDAATLLEGLSDRSLVRSYRVGMMTMVELFHPRIRSGTVERESPEARARMHLALAQVLETSNWGSPDVLFAHYFSGGQRDRVGSLALKAANQALSNLEFARATELYRTALSFLPPDQLSDVKELLVRALALSGDGIGAADLLEELAKEAEGVQRLCLRRRAAHFVIVTGHIERGVVLLDSVLTKLNLGRISDPVSKFSLIQESAIHRFRSFFRLTPPRLLQEERFDAAWGVAIVFQLIDPIKALVFHLRARREANDLQDPVRIFRSDCLHLVLKMAQHNGWEGYRREERRLRGFVAENRDPFHQGLLATSEGVCGYVDGTYRSGHRVLAGAENALKHTDAPFLSTVARVFRVRCLVYTGKFSAARALRDQYEQDASSRDNRLLRSCLRGDVIALLDLAADDPQRVKESVVDVVERWSGGRWPFQRMFALRADVLRLLYQDEPDAASAVMYRLRKLLRTAHLNKNRSTRLHLMLLEGSVALANHSSDRLHAAILSLRRQSHRHADAFASILEGGAAAQAGDAERAAQCWRIAEDALDRSDLGMYTAVVRRARGRVEKDHRLIAAAEGWMEHEGVVDLAHFCRTLLPGLDERGL